MNKCSAIWIGGSAGSLDVLLKVLPQIKEDIDFAIVIVLHRKPGADDLLTDLLSSRTNIPVKEIEEKDAIKSGVIYLAPSDYHLLVERNATFSLDHSEKVNYSRPSIDVAFESAADIYKDTLVGLLLSGANADGVAGLLKIKKMGGRVIIQHPDSAIVPYMPAQAGLYVDYDAMLQVEEMSDWINKL
jgi:two-component system chemotaxis response regulator CheB